MPNNREDDLKSYITRITKRIGEAKKAFDFNEVENLRNQRGSFVRALIEEFGQSAVIVDGKTVFMTTEEADEHYSNEDVQKVVGVSVATTELLQARDEIIKRIKRFQNADAEDVKTEVLINLAQEAIRIEKITNDINDSIGHAPIDFSAIDESRRANEDLLDGFDMSSLQ